MVNPAMDFCRRHLRPSRAMAQAVVVSCLLVGGNVNGASAATIVLDDFENGFAGMAGQLQATGLPAAAPKPGTQLGMRINLAGQGGCDHFVGDSNALCGADTKKWAGNDGVILRYDVNFSLMSSVLFDLAAFSDNDPFDKHDGENSNIWGDYLRVSSMIGRAKTLLAEFTGVPQSERTPETAFGLVSTNEGALLGGGSVTGASFETVRLEGVQGHLQGKGALLFEIRSTGSSEQIGLDNIRFAEVPLPASLSFSLIGLAVLVSSFRKHRRRQNATA